MNKTKIKHELKQILEFRKKQDKELIEFIKNNYTYFLNHFPKLIKVSGDESFVNFNYLASDEFFEEVFVYGNEILNRQ